MFSLISAALDVLGALDSVDKVSIINYIYSLQLIPDAKHPGALRKFCTVLCAVRCVLCVCVCRSLPRVRTHLIPGQSRTQTLVASVAPPTLAIPSPRTYRSRTLCACVSPTR